MKIEIEILEDQLELLENIKSIPKLIVDRIGKLPVCFPGGEYEMEQIQHALANLEFRCKKMIFDTLMVREQLSKIFTGTDLHSPSCNLEEGD